MHVDLIKLYGSMELAPLVGLADAIVDLVSTGSTLKANNLVAVEEIDAISARLVVNQAALKLKHALLQPTTMRSRWRRGPPPPQRLCVPVEGDSEHECNCTARHPGC